MITQTNRFTVLETARYYRDDQGELRLSREEIEANRNVAQWSSASHFRFEVPLTTAKTTANGFTAGETYFGSWIDPAEIWRISPDGTSLNLWAEITGEGGDGVPPSGLYIDQTGIYGGDLIVLTGWLPAPQLTGRVWRVNGATRAVSLVADLHTYPEGVITLPNDSAKYGAQWAGKILVGAGARRLVYALDAQGNYTTTDLGFCPGDFHIIPQDQDLYWLDFKFWNEAPSTLRKIPRDYFANIIGDLAIVQSGEFQAEDQPPDHGELFLVHWTGTAFIKMKITDSTPRHLEHATFAPLSLSTNP